MAQQNYNYFFHSNNSFNKEDWKIVRTYYSLTDEDLNGDYVAYFFSGTIDGDGHKIISETRDANNWSVLVYHAVGSTTIKNIESVVNGNVFTLVYTSGLSNNYQYDGTIETTLQNITLTKFPTAQRNDSGFVDMVFNSTLNMIGCVNNADYQMAEYGAIFMGGYPLGTATVNFEGCINNGDISGNNVYFFIGNANNVAGTNLTVTVDENCKNNGTLTGDKVALFPTNTNNPTMVELNNRYNDRTDLTSGFTVTSELAVNISYGSNNVLDISGDEGYTYDVRMSALSHFNIGGTNGVYVNLPYGDEFYVGWFLDKNTAEQKYGIDVEGTYASNGSNFPYIIKTLDDGQRVYIFDLSASPFEATLESKPTTTVSGYDVSGAFCGLKTAEQITSTIQQQFETYVGTFLEYLNLDFNLIGTDSFVVREGQSITFAVNPADGYAVSKVYANGVEISANTDGTYTYVPTSNFEITADVEQISYSVTYYVQNATLTNTSNTVVFGGSYTAEIVADEGYEITGIIVTMGSQNVTVVGNTVSIPEVTGNVVISIIPTLSPKRARLVRQEGFTLYYQGEDPDYRFVLECWPDNGTIKRLSVFRDDIGTEYRFISDHQDRM